MCFIKTEKEEGSKKLRFAWKPLKCFKVLHEDMTSNVIGFEYQMGRKYWRPYILFYFIYARLFDKYDVDYGFHSYIDINQVHVSEHGLRVECVIPRFSFYFENRVRNERVSTGIRLIKKIYKYD